MQTSTEFYIGQEITEHSIMERLHVGSVVQSDCPFPSHYTKQEDGTWKDLAGDYWHVKDFTLNNNQIEIIVQHVGDNPADHHLDTRIPAPAKESVPA